MPQILALKLTLVPLLIWGITLAGRRWGAAVAGWLSAFPVVSAPILFFIAREQGSAFAAESAAATLVAVLANLGFGLTYAWSATRNSWPVSFSLGMLSFAVAVVALNWWSASLIPTCAVVFGALFLARFCYPAAGRILYLVPKAGRLSDLPWRMAAGALLVLLVTGFAARLGARMSGLLAMFPVMASVLAVFSHRQSGPAFVILLLRNMVWGYYAFAVFCAVLAVCLPAVAVPLAFLLSLAAAVLVQAAVRYALG